MSQISIDFSPADLKKIRDFQQRIPHLFDDYRLRKNIGQLLVSQAKRNINEGSPDGRSPYQTLNAQYVKYKGFDKPLIGRKKNTSTQKGTTNNRGVENGLLRKSLDFELGANSTIYLVTISYGKYHQFGGDKIPARPIYTIREENKPEIMRFIEQAAKRIANNSK